MKNDKEPVESGEPGSPGAERDVEALLEEHLPGLRGYIRLRTGHELRMMESSSDLVQSVCREILTHRERFQHPDKDGFRRWLYTTALRKLSKRAEHYRALKRDAKRVSLDGSGDEGGLLNCYQSFCTPSRAAVATEEVQRIEGAFDQLPESYREVITMARILGMSHAEIAEHTGSTEGATRTMLYRALARLAEVLEVE